MLDKKDLKAIEKIFDIRFNVNIKGALTEFFDTLILPYFERNEKDHAEIRATLKSHDKNFDTQDKDLDSIQRKLEKNEDDHEEMLRRLGKVERSSAKILNKN
ncbi:MAG: hypothetical protein HYW62_03250 [Candidatus Levybacteria bacterium]|nr:hypothetical protein [Candidatus Levybacteria bacterium]